MGLAVKKRYTVHWKILTGEILANHTGISYWRGNLVTVSAYAKYIFSVSVSIGEEIFWHNSPIFSQPKFFRVR